MGKPQRLFAVVALCALTCGCGGGGMGSSSVAPGVVGVAQQPAPPPGVVTASGPVTMLGAGAILGSTISPNSAVAVMTIDSASVAAPFSPGGTIASTAVIVTDAGEQAATAGTRTSAHGPPAIRRREVDVRIPDAPFADRSALLGLGQRIAGSRRSAAHVRRVQSFAVGDQHTFALQGGTIDGSNPNPKPIPMAATLVAQSAHANVWLDSAVATDSAKQSTEFPSGSADFVAVARAFETDFAVETRAFGPAYTTGIVNFEQCAADGTPLTSAPPRPDTTGIDPHINIVITDALRGSGEGGYFYGLDMLDQTEANCVSGAAKPTVNGLPMLVIESDDYQPYSGSGAANTYPANNEAYWLRGDMPQTLAHEFQHYLHFVNKYLQQHVDRPNDPTAGTLDDAFIDEGCSVLAQDLVADSTAGMRESPLFVRSFLLEPADFSLMSFAGYQPNAFDSTSVNPPYGYFRNTAGNYGFAYLFVRYLYDRFGPGALKAIYAETNVGGAREPDTGPATAAAGGESFPRLFTEFTTALAVHSGGGVGELTTDPAFRFDSSVILRGPVQTYSRRLAPYDVRTIVQPGPLNPERFSGGFPIGLAALATGQPATIMLLAGGAAFVTPQQPWPRGATLRATGALGGGSVVQGSLPTPAPASY